MLALLATHPQLPTTRPAADFGGFPRWLQPRRPHANVWRTNGTHPCGHGLGDEKIREDDRSSISRSWIVDSLWRGCGRSARAPRGGTVQRTAHRLRWTLGQCERYTDAGQRVERHVEWRALQG